MCNLIKYIIAVFMYEERSEMLSLKQRQLLG